MVLFHANLAARLGLGATDTKVLEIVARHGSLTPKQLVAMDGLAPASITGVLDRLEAKRFVNREASAQDRRQVHVLHSPEHARAVGALFADLLAALPRSTRVTAPPSSTSSPASSRRRPRRRNAPLAV